MGHSRNLKLAKKLQNSSVKFGSLENIDKTILLEKNL